MEITFEVNPDMFNRAKVWAVGRVSINRNIMELEELLNNLGCMNWSVVLLKFRIANGAVDMIDDWEKNLKQPTIDTSIDQLYNQRCKCTTVFVPEASSDHRRNRFFLSDCINRVLIPLLLSCSKNPNLAFMT